MISWPWLRVVTQRSDIQIRLAGVRKKVVYNTGNACIIKALRCGTQVVFRSDSALSWKK